MHTVLPDGRVFETQEFLKIDFNPDEPVYKYTFQTMDRNVKSSARHEWVIWNKLTKDIEMIKMVDIKIEEHELLVQGWENQ